MPAKFTKPFLEVGLVTENADAMLHFVGPEHADGQRDDQLPIDLGYVRSLSPERLAQPVLLVYFGRGGLIALPDLATEAAYVLADGNHRLARAYIDGVQRMVADVVCSEEANKYWSPLETQVR